MIEEVQGGSGDIPIAGEDNEGDKYIASPRAIGILVVLGIFLPFIAFCQTYSWEVSIPFALAPEGEFGGALVPEFDRRTLNSQPVYQRRVALRIGWTPAQFLTFWGEGGVASLQLFEGDHILQGANGPAVGGGWSYLWVEPLWKGWTPFASGRATYLQSKLSDDQFQGSGVQSRRSRFDWVEYSGIIGSARHWNWGDLQTGLCFRILNQDEFRSHRSGTSVQKSRTTYSSGFQPGVALGANILLGRRLTLWIVAESSLTYQKVTVSFGQWGAP